MSDAEPMPEPQWDNEPPYPDPGTVFVPAVQPVPPLQQQVAVSHENHMITLSFGPTKEPNITVRGDSAVEINHALAEIRNGGVLIQLQGILDDWRATQGPSGYVQQQLGATPIGPPQPSPGPAPFDPNSAAPASGQWAPPAGGQWGAQPPAANGWGSGQQQPQPTYAPPGWYKVNAPYPERDAFKMAREAISQQNPAFYRSNMKFDKLNKTWLISPELVQYFSRWSPQPA